MKKILLIFFVVVILVVIFLFFRTWILHVRPLSYDLTGLPVSIEVDGRPVGSVEVGDEITVKGVKSGEHTVSVFVKGVKILEEIVKLPFLSFSRKKKIALRLPDPGRIDLKWKDSEKGLLISVNYNGKYPIDEWILKWKKKVLTSREGSFILRDVKEEKVRGILIGRIEGYDLLRKFFEVRRNLVNLEVELSGCSLLLPHARIIVDGGEIERNVKLLPGTHRVDVLVDNVTLVSTSVSIFRDEKIVLNLPELSRITPTLSVEDGRVHIKWKVSQRGLKPVKYVINDGNGNFVTEKSEISLKWVPERKEYTITPIYPGGISGKPIKIVKPEAPKVEIEGLEKLTSRKTLTLRLPSTEGTRYEILLNGEKVSSSELSLKEGTNTLTILASDVFGQVSSKTCTIFSDTTPPTFVFDWELKDSELSIEATASEEATFIVRIGDKMHEFSKFLKLKVNDAKDFTIWAKDVVGNVSDREKVDLVTPPSFRVSFKSPKLMKIDVDHGSPYEEFLIKVKAGRKEIVKETKSKETVLEVPPACEYEVSVEAIFNGIESPATVLRVSNPSLEGKKLIEGYVHKLREGEIYVAVDDVVLKESTAFHGNIVVEFLEDSGLLVEGDVLVKDGFLLLKPLEKTWKGIRLLNSSRLENVHVEGAEIGIHSHGFRVALKNVRVSNCILGSLIQGGNGVFESVEFKDNDVGVEVRNSDVFIEGSVFSGNGVGVKSVESRIIAQNTRFHGNDTAFNGREDLSLMENLSFSGNRRGMILKSSFSSGTDMKFFGNDLCVKVQESVTAFGDSSFMNNILGIYYYLCEATNTLERCSFENNKMDVWINGSGNVLSHENSLNNYVDGKKFPSWVDDRGVLRPRGLLMEKKR